MDTSLRLRLGKGGSEPSGRRKTSSCPAPGRCLSRAPGQGRVAGVRWGWSQQKAEPLSASPPPPQKKASSPGPWPLPPQPPVRKSAKHYHKMGGGVSPRGSEPRLLGPVPSPCAAPDTASGAVGPWAEGPSGHRGRPGLGQGHVMQCPGGTPTHTHSHPRLRASDAHCPPLPAAPSPDTEPGAGWRHGAAGRGWSEVGGLRPPCCRLGPGPPLPRPALHCPPSA